MREIPAWLEGEGIPFHRHRFTLRPYLLELLDQWVDEAHIAGRSFKPVRPANPTVLTDAERGSLRVPVLSLVDENEKIYSAHEAVQRLNRVAPQVETDVIPGAGHGLTVVQADLVNEMVLDFLARSQSR